MSNNLKIMIGFLTIIAFILLSVIMVQNMRPRLPGGHYEKVVNIEDWSEFESTVTGFRVLLPELPSHNQEDVTLPDGESTVRYHVYLCEARGGSTFMVSVMRYPDQFSLAEPSDLLQSVVNEMIASNAGNEIDEMENIRFLGQEAIEFALTNKDILIRSRAFLFGKSLYVLTLIDRDETFTKKEFEAFTGSFQLLSSPLDEEEAGPEEVDSAVEGL